MARSSCGPLVARTEISAEKVTCNARAIFHNTLMVGALWPSSIWPNIARLTPESWASASSDSLRWPRRRRKLPPTTGAKSVGSEAVVGVDVAFAAECFAVAALLVRRAGFFFSVTDYNDT